MFISRIYHNNNFCTRINIPSLLYNKYIIKWQGNYESNINSNIGEFMLIYGKLNIKIYQNDKITENILNIYEINNNIDINKYKIINNTNKLSYTYHREKKL